MAHTPTVNGNCANAASRSGPPLGSANVSKNIATAVRIPRITFPFEFMVCFPFLYVVAPPTARHVPWGLGHLFSARVYPGVDGRLICGRASSQSSPPSSTWRRNPDSCRWITGAPRLTKVGLPKTLLTVARQPIDSPAVRSGVPGVRKDLFSERQVTRFTTLMLIRCGHR
jgi:hypothetical protein